MRFEAHRRVVTPRSAALATRRAGNLVTSGPPKECPTQKQDAAAPVTGSFAAPVLLDHFDLFFVRRIKGCTLDVGLGAHLEL